MKRILFFLPMFFLLSAQPPAKGPAGILFRHATLIDGRGGQPLKDADILVKGDRIAAIGQGLKVAGAAVVNLEGKTMLPALISDHVHVGLIHGPQGAGETYTREHILGELAKYQDYGIGTIQVMGTDRPMLFDRGIRDSSQAGLLPGARLYSAGYGFGMPAGAPPVEMGMTNVFRPTDASQVAAEMDSLVRVKPDMVKLWIDDFGGKYKAKMSPAVYGAIIREAHARGLRVAAHVYYLSDARSLVGDGVDILAHSIRDSVIDDGLLAAMQARHVAYIPTLSLDEYAYIYARRPEWIDDAFFKASLEPGVYALITSKEYQDNLQHSPAFARNMAAFEIALQNLKKIFDAGILVCLGTDSGAMMLRAQGFSEHLELQLMVQAGLTPLQALTAATQRAAQLLHIDGQIGTLEKGKIADLLIVDGNPATDIRDTRKIVAVYKAGTLVSKGPLHAEK